MMTSATGTSDSQWPWEIVASHHTLSGVPIRTASRFGLGERLLAARAAGFTGIGTTYIDYRWMLARGHLPEELRRETRVAGITVVELEMLYGWNSSDQEIASASRHDEDTLHEMAELFQSRQVNVGVTEPVGSSVDLRHTARAFKSLCERADKVGLTVALEFLPWTAVPDLETAYKIVDSAGVANGGILIDSWHFFRGEGNWEALTKIAADYVASVQIDDADTAIHGTLFEDSTLNRRLPGQGSFPLVSWLRTLRSLGLRCPLSVEIISKYHQLLDVRESAEAAYASTADVLALSAASDG
jgi:sugar phosphate isomerase/epimerase